MSDSYSAASQRHLSQERATIPPGTTVSGKGPYGRVIAGAAAAMMRW